MRFCRVSMALAPALALTLPACSPHPLLPLETSLQAAVHETYTLPTAPKVDLLFVVDDSGSMQEEQDNLARNFARLAEWLQTDLGGRASVRIAVTSTDFEHADRRGAFVAPTTTSDANCDDLPLIDTPPGWRPTDPHEAPPARPSIDTPPGWRPTDQPILHAGSDNPDLTAEALTRRVACLTHLGTRGSNREKGLEAMRAALSCEGPNAAVYGACCVPGPDGRRHFDRECAAEPEFLRPDALLAVVFLSDEDDCSDPAASPAESKRSLCRGAAPQAGQCDPGESATLCRARLCDIAEVPVLAICRHGPADSDRDGVPDAYGDPVYCRSGDKAGCFAVECGARDAATCHHDLCAAPSGEVAAALRQASLSNCAWFPDVLTPVDDYAAFLRDLKADPDRQVIVEALTGVPDTAATGAALRATLPLHPRDAACAAEPLVNPQACCPDGFCEGPPHAACESSNGTAQAGFRYLALARDFGVNGLGCRGPDDPDCVTLCDGDLTGAIKGLATTLYDGWFCYCLDGAPVPDSLRVELTCPDGTCSPGPLPPDAYTVESRDVCPSGAAVCLNEAPPPGARVTLDLLRAPDNRDTVAVQEE